MSVTDAISIFAEGTYEEQILELVNYIARPLSDEQRPAFIQTFQDALVTAEGQKLISEDDERRRQVLSKVLDEVKDLGSGSEREIEGFFNLVFSHLLALFPFDSSQTKHYITGLLQTISASSEPSITKYRIISNLFNTIPKTSGLRFPVQQTLLEIASTHDELNYLALSTGGVEKWLSEWEISPEEKSSFLKTLVEAYSKAGDAETSYQYTLAYVRSLPLSSAESAAVSAISTALRSPTVFDFDPLFRLDAVVAAKSHEIFSLLQIFLNDGLSEYKAWEATHADLFPKYDLDKAQLERKIRLLSLATLAFQNIGRDVAYSVLSKALQVEQDDVERWVIDAIRAGLVSGKLSQTTHTFHVVRATARLFEREQWEVLEKRLAAWKTGLASVLEVVASAKKRNGTDGPATTALETGAPQPQEAAA
ncbi:PCI-domain-containing protein [Cristinia sonorae]|uniref:Eukaryotic translation initiation factor 3 subunit M n=1 Tax=Cristinia sonorae TaxID=1940300 RepID=A0A8K0UL26_9AGAR|nr:PCI-domain-containing protein [Cristinia sonorae]